MNAVSHPAAKKIYLARHGQSIANLEQRISGQLDTPLTDKGLAQADALRDVLMELPLCAVYASSLSRASDTARPTAVAHGLPITVLDNLREIHFGILQGRVVDERDPEARTLWLQRSRDKDAAIPGAEPYREFKRRVCAGVAEILRSLSGAALIVAHRNTNQVILESLLAAEADANFEVNVKNKHVYEIELLQPLRITTIRLGGDHHGARYEGLK